MQPSPCYNGPRNATHATNRPGDPGSIWQAGSSVSTEEKLGMDRKWRKQLTPKLKTETETVMASKKNSNERWRLCNAAGAQSGVGEVS